MFGLTRWSPVEDMFSFQREVDRLFNQFWSDLPTRTATAASSSFHVTTDEEGWRIDVPLPGIDPQHVELETAGTTLAIRVKDTPYERTMTVPQFLDLDKIRASHRHGMLQLTLPLKDTVKPRRVPIAAGAAEDTKQLTAVA
jgi:HSP20 family protein